jgi:hypothetical protein
VANTRHALGCTRVASRPESHHNPLVLILRTVHLTRLTSTMKLEALCSSETLALTYQVTRHHVSQHRSVSVMLPTIMYIWRVPSSGTTPCSDSACHLLSGWFLACLIFRPWKWRRYIPPKRRLTLNGLHGVISPEENALHNHRCENLKSYNNAFNPLEWIACICVTLMRQCLIHFCLYILISVL